MILRAKHDFGRGSVGGAKSYGKLDARCRSGSGGEQNFETCVAGIVQDGDSRARSRRRLHRGRQRRADALRDNVRRGEIPGDRINDRLTTCRKGDDVGQFDLAGERPKILGQSVAGDGHAQRIVKIQLRHQAGIEHERVLSI